MKQHLSDILSYENDDIRAEYIYQRIFGFRDVPTGCLAALREVFALRHPLADKPGRPLDCFVNECRKASGRSVLTEGEERVEVALPCLVVRYEAKRKCLTIVPTERVRLAMAQGADGGGTSHPAQRYWVTPQFFPPLSVFRALDRECARILADYERLQAWQNTEACLAMEKLAREMFAEVERLHALWPAPWEETLIFGFPAQDRLRLSFALRVEEANGKNGILTPSADWKHALHTLLMQKLVAERERIDGELRLLQTARKAFRARTDYVVSLSELDAIPVLPDTKIPEEAYYLTLMIKKARSQQANFLVEDFMRRYRFFVKGKRTDAQLLLDAEHYMDSDCEVRHGADGRLLSVVCRFPLFVAEYDFRLEHLTVTLDPGRFAEFPTADPVLHFDKEAAGTHFSIRVLCDCHYALLSAIRSIRSAQQQVLRDDALFRQRSACLRSVLFTVGGVTIPVGQEPPLFQLYLQPVSRQSLAFRLEPLTEHEQPVTASLPLASFESALKVWWSRWKMKRIMEYKKREKSLSARVDDFDRLAFKIDQRKDSLF